MITKDEALKLALEALEGSQYRMNQYGYQAMETTIAANNKAITAIREALAEQPAQKEPVAWHGYDLDGMVEAFDRVIQAHCHSKHPFHNPVDSDARMALRILRGFIPSMKRYTSPPASKPEPTEKLVSAAGLALEVLKKHRQMKGEYPVGMLGVRAVEEIEAAFREIDEAAHAKGDA